LLRKKNATSPAGDVAEKELLRKKKEKVSLDKNLGEERIFFKKGENTLLLFKSYSDLSNFKSLLSFL
jgi:hypothetical protein